MTLPWQEAVVAVLVLASAAYASWRLMPMRRRLWLLERLLPQAKSGLRSRLRQAAAADAARGCAGCSEAATPGRNPQGTSNAAGNLQGAGARHE